MIKFSLGLFFLAVFGIQQVTGQNIKTEDLEYRYVKLPLTPLPKTILNYQSLIKAPYELENEKKRVQYQAELDAAEAEYQKEMAAYPAKVKAADDKYAAEMVEWEKKSLAEKVVEKQLLNENNKPVKQVPSPPYKRSVTQPNLKTSYDYAALASTYLVLDGYNNSPENAVKIEVILNGFDYTKPRQLSEQKSMVSTKNGTSTTSQVTYYHVEFTYRHTMSVKVTMPDGKELFFLTPQELNTYKTYKGPESTTSVSYNEEQLVKTYEEKILQENLTLINNLVNDKIGFKRETRKTTLSYVKTKDEVYSDLLIAYNEALSGFKTIVDDEGSAKTKLLKANEAWNNALNESDPTNKKARIDKDVTLAIYFNLLESSFVMRDVSTADKIFATMNSMSLSNNERKQKEDYETLFNDLKKRIQANQ